jgi:hypothetical protein
VQTEGDKLERHTVRGERFAQCIHLSLDDRGVDTIRERFALGAHDVDQHTQRDGSVLCCVALRRFIAPPCPWALRQTCVQSQRSPPLCPDVLGWAKKSCRFEELRADALRHGRNGCGRRQDGCSAHGGEKELGQMTHASSTSEPLLWGTARGA